MRKPKTVKEMYQRFSELCINSICMNSDCKFLIKKHYWFAVPVEVRKGLTGINWTIADLTSCGSIMLENECMDDRRKNWKYTYEKDIPKTK